MEPGSNAAEIWYALTESIDAALVDEARALLSAEERAKHDRFVVPEDRRDYAAAHGLLRRMVGGRSGIPPADLRFGIDGRGKPFVASADRPPQFNLSHTRGLVACAVARDADVGVDVERIDRVVDDREIAQRFFSVPERQHLDACGLAARSERFIEIWVLKEAYLKATGAGLSDELDRFSFGFPGDGVIAFDGPGVSGAWTFALFAPTPATRMAVALRSDRHVTWDIAARMERAGGALRAIRRGSSQ